MTRSTQKESSKAFLFTTFFLLFSCTDSFTAPLIRTTIPKTQTSTSLNTWFFGGSPTSTEVSTSGDSCELVPVRIENTSPNSRRIAGDISVEAPIEDVWAILTDYDKLSTHVPNLVESRRLRGYSSNGEQGDGSYKCRLYQKGAQKIVGFQFGADVTMDMTESVVMIGERELERRIGFKCIESPFFSEFDGEWKVQNNVDGSGTTMMSYTVDVRPRGPVPVAALEWRIREDVPTNLRAVKKAALEVGERGVLAMRMRSKSAVMRALPVKPGLKMVNETRTTNARPKREKVTTIMDRVDRTLIRNQTSERKLTTTTTATTTTTIPSIGSDWRSDETLGAYLKD